jgi:hypothetical protein
MWLKGCPKCRGDLFEEPAIGPRSIAGSLVICLQCGHLLSDDEERRLRRRSVPRLRRPAIRVA